MGTETNVIISDYLLFIVEKMGPLRGDGNRTRLSTTNSSLLVEKMGPLRGDGNYTPVANTVLISE